MESASMPLEKKSLVSWERVFRWVGGKPLRLAPEENVSANGPATAYHGLEAVGGWLWLTDERLAFTTHPFNLHDRTEEWALTEVVSVERRRTAWIIPNGIKITFRDGLIRKLAVQMREEWIERIERRIKVIEFR